MTRSVLCVSLLPVHLALPSNSNSFRLYVIVFEEDEDVYGVRKNWKEKVFGVVPYPTLDPFLRRSRMRVCCLVNPGVEGAAFESPCGIAMAEDGPGASVEGKNNLGGIGSMDAFGRLKSSRNSFAVKATCAGPRLDTILMCSMVDLCSSSMTDAGMSRGESEDGSASKSRPMSKDTFP